MEPAARKKLVEFPPVEGGETLQEFLGQYKKCCLNKKAALKSAKERLVKDQATGYEFPGCVLETFSILYVVEGLMAERGVGRGVG